MRTISWILVLAFVGALIPASVPSHADTGSISRDARGSTTYGDHDPLGGPPTPRVHGFGQATIFVVGLTLLALAALLGVYTFARVRRVTRPTG